MKEKKEKSLEEELKEFGGSDEVVINKETEFHAIANALKEDTVDAEGLSTSDQNSNLHPREIPLLLAVDHIFSRMGRTAKCPTRHFKRLKKSMGGFMVNKLVAAKQADNEKESGAPMLQRMFGSSMQGAGK